MTVTSNSAASESTKKRREKPQSKDILVDANLRLKHGIRYGLVGRNGTGKSSKFVGSPYSPPILTSLQALLRAIADRLIPGLSSPTMTISSMDQIAEDGEQQAESSSIRENGQSPSLKLKTILEFVIDSDDQKRVILSELQGEICTTNVLPQASAGC